MAVNIIFMIIVYLLTVVGWWLGTYWPYRDQVRVLGDILDRTVCVAYIPFVNTLVGILLVIGFLTERVVTIGVSRLQKNKVWNRIRNIKIKK